MAILNSRIAQFIFEKKYNSVKVLRSHIESIPIPVCDRKAQEEIIKIVDKILNCKKDYSELYKILEKKTARLYNLTPKEYKLFL